MNPICYACDEPTSYLFQHPLDERLSVCFECRQDVLEMIDNDEKEGKDEH